MGTSATAGSEARRVYLDQVDEALQRAQNKGPGRPGTRAPRRQVADIAIRRLRDAEKIARKQRKLLRDHADDPSFQRAFNETTKSITNLLEAIRRNGEGERKAFAGLSEEQLEQVFRSQLLRNAHKLNEGERRDLLTIWFGADVADVLLQPREPVPVPPAEAA
jgi:hypothetical protein